MKIFLARQPILNSNKKVCAYEILYRSGSDNKFADTPGDTASAQVMINTFQTFGIENLTDNKPAFINFTSELIKQELATLFCKEYLVVEILENLKIDEDILHKCIDLKQKGYKLALDDFVCSEAYKPLVKIADIIKFDFRETARAEIETMIKNLKGNNLIFLAEKVETHEEFEYAKSLGCTLFQGYFFQKPEIMSSRALSPLKISYLQIMKTVNRCELDFEELADLISRDLSLTYNLLRLVNSAAFALEPVSSVKQALIILGENEVRKWVNLVALRGLGEEQPDELMRNSLIRAKFCELIAEATKCKDQAADLFLVGLFSLIDTILQKPLEEILEEIKPPNEVKKALLDKGGKYGEIYKAVICYEQGLLDEVACEKDKLKIKDIDMVNFYIKSLLWYNDLSKDM